MDKLLLYLSAFVPMYVLLALKLVIDLAFGNLSFNVLNSMTLGLLVLLTGLGILGLVRAMKKIECHAQIVQIESATNCTDEQFFNYFSLFVLFFSTHAAYGSSWARGRIRAAAAALHHSEAGSEPCLRPTPQLTATPDP